MLPILWRKQRHGSAHSHIVAHGSASRQCLFACRLRIQVRRTSPVHPFRLNLCCSPSQWNKDFAQMALLRRRPCVGSPPGISPSSRAAFPALVSYLTSGLLQSPILPARPRRSAAALILSRFPRILSMSLHHRATSSSVSASGSNVHLYFPSHFAACSIPTVPPSLELALTTRLPPYLHLSQSFP
ncbi:hypothetical protein C8R45DRAFT_1217503 [Mycena sanguinolenta]|nr:hypothetical protein C8R45DRAFT_1217503 [Mycena sanguinolenta]